MDNFLNHDNQECNPQECSDELSACHNELIEWKNKYVRLGSDFENYKKRISKEQASWTAESQAIIFADLLVIMDNFDRALEHEQHTANPDHEMTRSGMSLMRDALAKIFKKYGIREMDNSTHFDPAFHLAIAHTESDTVPSGNVIAVHEKGYLMNNRVLREAKVTVAQ